MRRKLVSDEGDLSLELTRLIILIAVIGGLSTAGVFAYSAYLAPPSAKMGVISIDDTVYSFGYVHQIENALADNSIKAVVVKISSPGGSADACFQTEESLSRLAAEKLVVAELEEYAVSGAYLIASASDYIYTHSQTVTGGLGVICVWVSYENYYEKEGIHFFIWRSGGYKDWFAPWRDPTENEIAEIENLVNDYANRLFERIISNRSEKVADNRQEFENLIGDLRDGRTIDGSEALTYGLADNLGGRRDAIEEAAEMAGLEDGEYQVVNLSE